MDQTLRRTQIPGPKTAIAAAPTAASRCPPGMCGAATASATSEGSIDDSGGPVRRRPPHGPSPHPHRGVSLLSTCASVGCAQHYLAKPPGPVGSVQAGRRTASTEQALSPVSPSTASQLAMLGGSQLWPRAGGAHTYAHSKQYVGASGLPRASAARPIANTAVAQVRVSDPECLS